MSRFLLSPPDHFSINYAINPFMHEGDRVNRDRAREQWQRLRDMLREAGASIEMQRPAAGLPDLVFTNNAALVYDGRALLSRFRHRERAGEVEHNARKLSALGFAVESLPPQVEAFEGMAEVVIFGGHAVCAAGERTSIEAARHVARFLRMPEVTVWLVDPRFYHLDVAFCALDERRALVVPDAFDALSLRRIKELVPEPIELELSEALAFCANSVVVDDVVIMHHVPVRLARILEAAGFTPVETPVGEFLKSGGSVRCMSLRLDLGMEDAACQPPGEATATEVAAGGAIAP